VGKVRTETIKRVANELVDKYPKRFTNAFDENKKGVEELVNYESKRLRNLIAGYVTRLKCIQEMRATLPIIEDTETSFEENE
jgi:small subunit ribosomal protein S17e